MLVLGSNVQTRVSPAVKFPVQLHDGAAGHCTATNPVVPAKLPEIATPSVDVAAKLCGITERAADGRSHAADSQA
jgi:hypothetical protein